jgi:hypothetical protein
VSKPSSNSRSSDSAIQSQNVGSRIRAVSLELLGGHPQGLRYSQMVRHVLKLNPAFNNKTVSNVVWSLDAVLPERVYKPSKGVYRLLQFRDVSDEPAPALQASSATKGVREEEFYPLFAQWLKNEVEDVTLAIPLGGNAFRDKWGTPDVLGKDVSRASDLIKAQTAIVSAEIKADTAGLMAGFGQAAVYQLFSHRSWLVIPRHTAAEDMARVDSLCRMHGIGLVTFNPRSLSTPDFQLAIRPRHHEPDLYYTNLYLKRVERELFS